VIVAAAWLAAVLVTVVLMAAVLVVAVLVVAVLVAAALVAALWQAAVSVLDTDIPESLLWPLRLWTPILISMSNQRSLTKRNLLRA